MPIGPIKLQAAGKSLSLTDLVNDICRFIAALEQAIQPEFDRLGANLSADSLVVVELRAVRAEPMARL